MLVIFHVAAEVPNREFPYDSGPVAMAKESMTTVVGNLLTKFGAPTEIYISPYHISQQTYRLIKPLFDSHKVRIASIEPRLSKFISNRVSEVKLMPRTLEGQVGNYLKETEEKFKRRVKECYESYLQKASVPSANIWLLTHSDVMEQIAILARCKFDRPVDYHAFLGIPPRGDMLAGGMQTRTPPAIPPVEPDLAMSVVSVPSSSTQTVSQPKMPNHNVQTKISRRELVKIKRRRRREQQILKHAVVSYPKKSGFRVYESSSSSSDSDSYSDSSDSSEDDVVLHTPEDILNSRVGGVYAAPSSRHVHSKHRGRSSTRPIILDLREFEPQTAVEKKPVGRKGGKERRVNPGAPWYELSRYGDDFEGEFLKDSDLESIP